MKQDLDNEGRNAVVHILTEEYVYAFSISLAGFPNCAVPLPVVLRCAQHLDQDISLAEMPNLQQAFLIALSMQLGRFRILLDTSEAFEWILCPFQFHFQEMNPFLEFLVRLQQYPY